MTSEPISANTGFEWPVWLRRRGWTLGVWLLLVLMIGLYATLIPKFGAFQIASIAKNSLPLVYLAVGQAIIVIAGGIDLSVGAMMVLSNAIAAQLMFEQPLGVTLAVAVLVILIGAAINALVGWIIAVSRVPDIVVTLATSFILSGVALVVLPSPGAGQVTAFAASSPGLPRVAAPTSGPRWSQSRSLWSSPPGG